MYYRLRENYALRGWEQMTAILVKRPYNLITTLEREEFHVLMLCDGVTDFSELELTQEEQDALAQLVHNEIIEPLEQPRAIEKGQAYRYHANRFVYSCMWSMTGRCNYRCRHCFMDAPEGAFGELSHEQAMDLIDQMADCGVLRVDLTGGEPFVRSDFWQLVDRMLSYRMNVSMIYTNGHLLTDEMLDQFDARGIKPEFSISYDGIGWHDWMRGIEGADEAALDALRRCVRRGFPVNVEMCLHRGNLSGMRATLNMLADIGVTAVKCANVSDTELWNANCEGNKLDFTDYLEAVLEYIPQFYADGMRMTVVMCDAIVLRRGSTLYEIVAGKREGGEECLDCHLCTSARAHAYIGPDGRLLPCLPLTACKEQEMFAKFQDVGLRKCLSDGFYMQFIDKRVKDLLDACEKCRNCEHNLVCAGGCRAAAIEQSGDPMGPDLTQCFLWENGYVDRLREAAEAGIAAYEKRKGATAHEN